MVDFPALLHLLAGNQVAFIIVGDDHDLLPHTVELELFGVRCRCLGLPIQVKRAAGRPKDLEALAELEVILEERG